MFPWFPGKARQISVLPDPCKTPTVSGTAREARRRKPVRAVQALHLRCLKMGDPQVTMGFNTKSWFHDLDDFGVPWLRKPSILNRTGTYVKCIHCIYIYNYIYIYIYIQYIRNPTRAILCYCDISELRLLMKSKRSGTLRMLTVPHTSFRIFWRNLRGRRRFTPLSLPLSSIERNLPPELISVHSTPNPKHTFFVVR